ncbi:hypothetical protein [Algoriphagus confluentis]|uniref:MORN repeat protein n=1 Tax=Algoriphagus confluentis TaxID=1697556 RepID=A0ABQ6PU76_9BACT|nr:hypothetical protein Aconfl_39520 [Algoriphagus confluentis]
MKRLVLILICLFSFFSLQAQVSEKELSGVEFLQMDDGKGGTIYGFTLGDKMIGPNYHVHPDGTKFYTYFNLEGKAELVQIMEVPHSGQLFLAEMVNGNLNGNAFQMIGKNLDWARVYKDGEPRKNADTEYLGKLSNRPNCVGNCIDAFGIYQTSGKQLAMGFFKKESPSTPIIHTFPSGSMYLGSMDGWDREGFGKYSYANDGSVYIGMWKKNMREGLGFWFNKDGSIRKKGYFKKDEVIRNM